MTQPNFYTKKIDQDSQYGKFILEPLPLSFGNSMGNALRRTLLSVLRGAAITQVKINDINHLFTTVKGVKESILDVVLNLKQLNFETQKDGSFKINLEIKGQKKVYGKDFKGEVKVANEDLYIAEVTDGKAKLEIEAIVETGIGALLASEQEKKDSRFIPIDAYFSPVKKVNFKVEEARVGRKTNFDRLIIEIWTNGTISPEEALRQASTMLSDHFSHVLSGKDIYETEKDEAEQKEVKEPNPELKEIIIDELNLPSRVINALLKENIETVADLVKVGKDKLIGIKGLGKKSFVLIEDELKKMNIEI